MLSVLQSIFKTEKPFIGMVHLRPTVGYTDYPGDDAFLNHAIADAQALIDGGVDGVLIENDRDQPPTILVTAEQHDCIAKAVTAIRGITSLPIGVGVLLNDWRASLDIAHTHGCQFVRIDVFVDRVSCPAGVIEPEAEHIMAHRKSIGAEGIAVFADIQVKHKTLLETRKTLTQSAAQAITAGAAGVVITGEATGQETPLSRIQEVKNAYPNFPVLVGAGITEQNVAEQFAVCDGAFIGTSLKDEHDRVDVARVQQLSERMHSL
jgi:membrane complex biogenesis BtpA family protein